MSTEVEVFVLWSPQFGEPAYNGIPLMQAFYQLEEKDQKKYWDKKKEEIIKKSEPRKEKNIQTKFAEALIVNRKFFKLLQLHIQKRDYFHRIVREEEEEQEEEKKLAF